MCLQSPPSVFITNTKGTTRDRSAICLGNILRNGKKNNKQTKQSVVISAHLHAPGGVLYRNSQDLPSGTSAELSLLHKAKQHE